MQLQFKILDTKPSTGERDILPPGWYMARIIAEDQQTTKSGNGLILSFTYQVTSGFYKNAEIVERYNIVNPNETAQRIARADISAIGVAVGAPNVNVTDPLMQKPMKVKLGVEAFAAQDGSTAHSNRIKAYKPVSDAVETIEVKTEFELPELPSAAAATPVTTAPPAWKAPAAAAQPAAAPTFTPPPATAVPEAVAGAPAQPWGQPAEAPVAAQPAWTPPAQAQAPAAQPAAAPTPEATAATDEMPAWMKNKA